MAFGVRDSTSNGAGSGTAITVTKPSGVVAGDIIVCVITINGVRTCADNNGSAPFTELLEENAGADTGTMIVYHRRATGDEGASFAFTGSGSDRWGIVCVAIQDAHPDEDFRQWPIMFHHADATTISTQNHYGYDGDLHFLAIAPDAPANTITVPTGYTELENVATNATIALAVKTLAADGMIGRQDFTISSAQATPTVAFTVRPAEAAAGASGPLTGPLG